MGWSLPWIATAVALLSVAGPAGIEWSRKRADYLGVLVGLVGLVLVVVRPEWRAYGWGLAVALPAAVAGARGTRVPGAVALASVAMATAWAIAPAADQWLLTSAAVATASLVLLGLAWLAHRAQTALLSTASLVPVVALASGFGFAGPGFRPAHAAVVLCLVAAVVTLILAFVAETNPKFAPPAKIGAVLGFTLIGILLSFTYFRDPAIAWGLGGGLVAMGIAWSLDLRQPGLLILGALIAVVIGALEYKAGHGFGVGITTLTAVAGALVLQRPQLLTALVPLMALLSLRLWREAHPYITRFYDISAMYGLVGILLGGLSAVALIEWGRQYQHRCAAARIAGVLVGVVAAGLIALIPITLGQEGILGFVLGVAMSALFVRPGPKASLAAFAWAGGALGFLAVLVDPLYNQTMLTRAEKLQFLAYPAVALLVALLGAAILATRSRALTPEEAA